MGGTVVCFLGAPGVGKSVLVGAMTRLEDREFYRLCDGDRVRLLYASLFFL